MFIRFVLLVCAIAAFAGPAAAQGRLVLLQPGLGDIAQRAAALHSAWLAAGHADSPDPSPSIVSGRIRSKRIDVRRVPATPVYSLTFTAPRGLAEIDATFQSATSAQFIDSIYIAPPAAPMAGRQTVSVEDPFATLSLYTAPGQWSLFQVTVIDQSGALVSLQSQALSAIFPSLTMEVTNSGTADITNPVLQSAAVLTPTVSLSSANPDFSTALTVADDLAGVYRNLVFVMPPGPRAVAFGYINTTPAPVRSGTIRNDNPLKAYPDQHEKLVGKWRITGYEICDAASNCLFDIDERDVRQRFGTTSFIVTK